ncbi:MAG: cell division protein FtsZ, partial [Pseudomonadota bacterium]
DGKIRVSVVATGIEQSASGSADTSAPIALSSARAPKRPVLELGGDAEAGSAQGEDEDKEEAAVIPPLTPPVFEAPEPEPEPEPEMDVEPEAANEAEPFDLSGMQAGDDMGDEGDDVDGIVDPLAGLRGLDDEDGPVENEMPEPADDGHFGEPVSEGTEDKDDALDLTGEYSDEENADESDDLLANADRLSAEDKPVEARSDAPRKKPVLGGDEVGTGAAAGGSTLFERMANLSRATGSDEDEEDGEDGDDDAPALSIPRFLGRQNNQ